MLLFERQPLLRIHRRFAVRAARHDQTVDQIFHLALFKQGHFLALRFKDVAFQPGLLALKRGDLVDQLVLFAQNFGAAFALIDEHRVRLDGGLRIADGH